MPVLDSSETNVIVELLEQMMVIVLNRPMSLNSLILEMIRLVQKVLDVDLEERKWIENEFLLSGE